MDFFAQRLWQHCLRCRCINPNQLNQKVQTESIKASASVFQHFHTNFFTRVEQALLVFGRRLAPICAKVFTADICVRVAPSMRKTFYNKLLCNLTEKLLILNIPSSTASWPLSLHHPTSSQNRYINHVPP